MALGCFKKVWTALKHLGHSMMDSTVLTGRHSGLGTNTTGLHQHTGGFNICILLRR